MAEDALALQLYPSVRMSFAYDSDEVIFPLVYLSLLCLFGSKRLCVNVALFSSQYFKNCFRPSFLSETTLFIGLSYMTACSLSRHRAVI